MEQATTHRIVVPKRGGPDVLEFIDEIPPKPEAGEVRIRVATAGVSAFDLMVRSRSFPGFPKVPFTPGCDIVGIVDELGEGVTSVEPGQMVAGGPFPSGGYTESICLPAPDLVPIPPGIDPAAAVCLVANYTTAHLMLHEVAKVEPGQHILVQGAAGGVGTATLDLGRLAGLEMYGTASPKNHELVAGFGATPIDYRNENVAERVRSLTGGGVDAVFDPIGGARQLWRSYRTLRKGGCLVWFGVAAIKSKGIWVIPTSLATRLFLSLLPDGKHAPLTPDLEKIDHKPRLAELLDLLAAGKLQPVVAERIPLREAGRAHALLERGGHAGRVVLVNDQ
jgi:NADPH:quinone reductase-like Zn-dependent oxidoreductase